MRASWKAAVFTISLAAIAVTVGLLADPVPCVNVEIPVIFSPVKVERNLLFFGSDGNNLLRTGPGTFSPLSVKRVKASFQPVGCGDKAWLIDDNGRLFCISEKKLMPRGKDFNGALALLSGKPLPYILFPEKLVFPDSNTLHLDFTATGVNQSGKGYIWIRGNGRGVLTDVSGKIILSWNSGSAETGPATIHRNILYTGASDGRLVALKMKNGREVFSFKCGGKLLSPPLVLKKLVVFCSSDHFVRALDRKTGMVVWQVRAEGRPSFGPFSVRAGLLISESAGTRLVILSGKDGRVGWNWKVPAGSILREPVVIDNKAFVLAWDVSSEPCLYIVPLPDKLPEPSSKEKGTGKNSKKNGIKEKRDFLKK